MIINLTDIIDGALVSAIPAVSRMIARPFTGREPDGLEVAKWLDTYALTGNGPNLPGMAPETIAELRDVLFDEEVQAALQSLLAVRLTDSPETQATLAREAVRLALEGTNQSQDLAEILSNYYDDKICELVSKLEACDIPELQQIRNDAFNSRIVAILEAIERQVEALAHSGRDDDTDFLRRYRRHVRTRHGKLRPPDLRERRQIPVENIYVDTTVLPHERGAEVRAGLTVLGLAELTDRTVLLGDPGSGKTTAANVLAYRCVGENGGPIPFLVSLRDFAAKNPPERSVTGHIEHTLSTLYQCPAPPGLIDRLLVTGRALVIFDGLDELLETSDRSSVSERIEQFCVEYPLSPVLVTSRLVGYDEARLDIDQFTCFRLGEFEEKQVREYAHKWFALQKHGRTLDAAAFLEESASVPDLRSNPLLLSLMCILYRGEGSLPRDRAGVYERCAELLFRQWDEWRRIHPKIRAGHLFGSIIPQIAFWLFTNEDRRSAVAERQLINLCTSLLEKRGFEPVEEAREAAREFVEFCRGRMWVLSEAGTTGEGERLYAFTHRTFLEYFVASLLANRFGTPEELAHFLLTKIHDEPWQLIAKLAIQINARSNDHSEDRVFAYILQRSAKLDDECTVLTFLAEFLAECEPSPATVKNLTCAALRKWPYYHEPLGILIAGRMSNAQLIAEEMSVHVAALSRSNDNRSRIYGHCLALLPAFDHWVRSDLPKGARTFWTRWSMDNSRKYAAELMNASADDLWLRTAALYCGVISIDQALSMPGGLTALMNMKELEFAGVAIEPYPVYVYAGAFWGSGDSSEKILHQFRDIGRHLVATRSKIPWGNRTTAFSFPGGLCALPPVHNAPERKPFRTPLKINSEYLLRDIDETTFLGIAVIAFATAEITGSEPLMVPGDSPGDPIQERLLRSHLRKRWLLDSYHPLARLPVPPRFGMLGREWADNDLNILSR
jgi:hypothetical protein